MTTRQLAHQVLIYLEDSATYKGGNDPAVKNFLDNVEQLALDVLYCEDKELTIDVELPNA